MAALLSWLLTSGPTPSCPLLIFFMLGVSRKQFVESKTCRADDGPSGDQAVPVFSRPRWAGRGREGRSGLCVQGPTSRFRSPKRANCPGFFRKHYYFKSYVKRTKEQDMRLTSWTTAALRSLLLTNGPTTLLFCCIIQDISG